MRRLVTLPIKTLAVTIIILAGALYMAAEARHAVIWRCDADLARIVEQVQTPAPASAAPITTNAPSAGKAPSAVRSEIGSNVGTEPAAATTIPNVVQQQDVHKRQIVVSIPDRRLALLEDGVTVKTYAIAVGARFSPSPDGDYVIINRAVNPVYRHKGKEIQPGEDNPLGSRWMGLSLKGYGIHGTNAPTSIGKAASHGCFRMRKEDVEDLYGRVQVGDPVLIRKERDALIAKVFPEVQKPAVLSDVQLASASSSDSTVTPAATTSTEQ